MDRNGEWAGKVRLWEAPGFAAGACFKLGGRVNTVQFSPDSRLLAAGGYGPLCLLEAPWSSARPFDLLAALRITTCALALSLDGNWLAAGAWQGLFGYRTRKSER